MENIKTNTATQARFIVGLKDEALDLSEEGKPKIKRDKKYYQAVAVMIGYIIGVGMFGLPLVTAKAGLAFFLVYLLGLGAVQYFVHLIYANMIVVTESFYRLPGYVGKYLGQRSKILVFIAKMVGNCGALIAYIVISGLFMHQLFGPILGGTPFIYSSLLFLLEAAVVFFGIGMIARVELYMSALLGLVVLLMLFRGLGVMEAANYAAIDWKFSLLPFGAMLMALDGNGAIPIVSKILKKDRVRVKSVIRISMLSSALITLIFVLTIVGISGANTTDDALSGVRAILDDGVVMFALIFGIFSMMTSFFGVSEAVKETLWWDFGLNKTLSWALAVFTPFILFLLGVNDLINIISFAGAVAGGFCAVMLMIVFMRLKKDPGKLVMFKRQPSNWLIYAIIGLFLIGIIYNIFIFIPGI
jgi:amino acid permease